MYIPKSQYVIKKVSELGDSLKGELGVLPVSKKDIVKYVNYLKSLKELVNPNMQVVKTAAGKFFSVLGIDFNRGDFTNAVELLEMKLDDDDSFEYESPIANESAESSKPIKGIKLPPTREDINKGLMRRCFYQNKATNKIKEITKYRASTLEGQTEKYETVVCVNWLVRGPLKDQTINGYRMEGIESINLKTLNALSEILPGVENIIGSPDEFVKDTLPIGKANQIPTMNSSFDIPSPSKNLPKGKKKLPEFKNKGINSSIKNNLIALPGEFLLEGTMREYVGPYHVHPTKGPMVGAQHRRTPHAKLVARKKAITRFGVEFIDQLSSSPLSKTEQTNTSGYTTSTSNDTGGQVGSTSYNTGTSSSPSPSPSPSPSYSPSTAPSGGGGY